MINLSKKINIKLLSIFLLPFLIATIILLGVVYQYVMGIDDKTESEPLFSQAPDKEYIQNMDTYNEELKACGLKVAIPKAYSIFSNNDYSETKRDYSKFKYDDDSSRLSYGRFSVPLEGVFVTCEKNGTTFSGSFDKAVDTAKYQYNDDGSKDEGVELGYDKSDLCKLLSMNQTSCDKIKDYKYIRFDNNIITNPNNETYGKVFLREGRYISFSLLFTDGDYNYQVNSQYAFETDIIYLPKLELK